MQKILLEILLYKNMMSNGISNTVESMINSIRDFITGLLPSTELSNIDFSKKLSDRDHQTILQTVDKLLF